MKRLPDAELELMMIIWEAKESITRIEITDNMKSDKEVVPSTILTLLSRLEKRGFVKVTKKGKVNYYTPLVEKDSYLIETSKGMLDRMFGGSLSDFVATLYKGREMSEEDLEELQAFIDSKTK